MARSIAKFVKVYLDNSGGTLQQITTINQIGGVGLDYPETNLTAWVDAIQGVLLGIPTFSTTIGGVLEATDHGVISGVNGGNTPLSFDVQIGLGRVWTGGDPQFGITSTASNGVLIRNYTVNPEAGTWQATVVMAAGSAAPAWGTAAET